jgi:hypothetical protein
MSLYRKVLGSRKIYNNSRFSGYDLPLQKQHMYRKFKNLDPMIWRCSGTGQDKCIILSLHVRSKE